MAAKMPITHERLLEVLEYDRNTGVFFWRINKGRNKAGCVAGYLGPDGYWRIGLDGKEYLRSRLAWFYETSHWPSSQIDHVDVNPSNDSISNLREATCSQNSANKKRYSNNTSGLKGAFYLKRARRWFSQIRANGKMYYLGYYDSAEKAHAAYCEAAERLNGQFARAS